MEVMFSIWTAVILGIAPLLGLLLWWWNDIWYSVPEIRRCLASGTKLPPGYMGIPFLGEMLSFLWYFKIARHPDDYINSKRRKYGDGVGLYRTHLFGSPSIIVYSPYANKFVLQDANNFSPGWPSNEIVGRTSLVAVDGDSHTRVRSYVLRATNQPDSLRSITLAIQPRVTTALQSWAKKGRITLFKEAKKVTFENIGKYFASFEPGPVLDNLDELFKGLVKGFRATPINLPGTTYHHALKCRKKVMAIFREELEKRKKSECYESTSLAIMWAFYYIAKYPDVLRKLQEEHLPISKKLNGDFITYEEISSCKYTRKVVEEIIRLANVAPCVFRTAKKDVHYKGYKIPKDWKVICWVRYVHTEPENFEDPMCFNPDRWDEQPKSGTHLVFGGGTRICAGNKLARLQVAVLLHHLVVGYRWELVNPNAKINYLPNPKPVDEVEIIISRI
ncbi:Ent-kaurenoic acid oxidase 1 [Forsythia ovata]|uniref:Ent-kaurenoic acid oxidase 1 n=1 Tax=Forsythia ovata TaxID=205694 RepID=A0ABD1R1X7_9LAMI